VDVLFAQRDLIDARVDLIETKQQQLSAVVNLYQAIGGGNALPVYVPEVPQPYRWLRRLAHTDVNEAAGTGPKPVPPGHGVMAPATPAPAPASGAAAEPLPPTPTPAEAGPFQSSPVPPGRDPVPPESPDSTDDPEPLPALRDDLDASGAQPGADVTPR
jgi:hypothetical protein